MPVSSPAGDTDSLRNHRPQGNKPPFTREQLKNHLARKIAILACREPYGRIARSLQRLAAEDYSPDNLEELERRPAYVRECGVGTPQVMRRGVLHADGCRILSSY
jgi:hypothetical protein